MVSAGSRPLRLRVRADLQTKCQTYLGRQYWVVKDPLALKYYRFEEEEFSLLQMLDGETSLQDLQDAFERRFAPQKITRPELHQLVAMLHRSALVVSDAAGQGEQLLRRHAAHARRRRLASLANILSIRFPGVDPDRLLTWLDRRVGWFFSRSCLTFCLCFVAAALLLIAAQFDVFQAKLPSFSDFFASRNWLWLAVTLGLTKVLHEFGHGLACKRFGGECHELGFMLLVFTPCLYCNVSDSWMLSSKWQRAAIGAAGMYVEIVLAAACTFLWWFTHPGLLHYLCLNVMFVCSVSTLLFNANPLLRYDGYYILSDLLEIPNLRQKASTILRGKLAMWTMGLPETPDAFLPQRRQTLFVLYALTSAVYRWVVTAAILWFLYLVFKPYGLQVIGKLLVVAVLVGLVAQPLWQLARFLYVPGRIDRVNRPRLYVSVAMACVAGLGIGLIPLPHHVRCSFYLQPRGAAGVYVESPGSLQQIHVLPGDYVRAGQPLLTLDNFDTRLALVRMEGERKGLQARLASLRQRAFDDEAAAQEIAETEEALAAVDNQIVRQQSDLQALHIVAPATGTIIPPATVPPPANDRVELAHWHGSPLEHKNLQAFLAAGVPLCQIGDPRSLEAILAIDQRDIEFVHVGQRVELFVAQLPGQALRSELRQISQLDMQATPRSLSSKAGGELLTRTDGAGAERPLSATYQGSAPLMVDKGDLLVGATGQAKIHTGYLPLAARVWRYLCQTFRFEV